LDIFANRDYTPHIFFGGGTDIMDHTSNKIAAVSSETPCARGLLTTSADRTHTRLAFSAKLKRSPTDPAAS
jgi:hypothetical protein